MRLLLVLVVACSSGKSQQAPVEDAKRAPVVVVDAAPPLDAFVPFSVVITSGGMAKPGRNDESVKLRPHDAQCPALVFHRGGKNVRIERCRDKAFTKQIDLLREMATYLRGTETGFDEVSVVGWGDYYSYPEFAKRLAAHAQKHRDYDLKKKSLNAYIIDAAAKEEMADELAVIFQRKPKLKSLEKCSHGRASNTDDIGKFLKEAGFKGPMLLPVGCAMAWWDLER